MQINVDLPESDSKVVASTDLAVQIFKDKKFKVNGKSVSKKNLEKRIAFDIQKLDNKHNGTISIIAETGTDWKEVHHVVKIASNLKFKAIIATKPKE